MFYAGCYRCHTFGLPICRELRLHFCFNFWINILLQNTKYKGIKSISILIDDSTQTDIFVTVYSKS